MAKKNVKVKSLRVANISSIAMVFFMSAAFVLDVLVHNIPVNYGVVGLVMILALMIVVSIIRNTINIYKLALNVPFVLLLFSTSLMLFSNWHSNHYLILCAAFCAISCIYSSFNRTAVFILFQNIVIAILVLRGYPISGHGVPLFAVLINWAICLFSGIIMLLITRYATIVLDRALEHQNSFNDLLASTENYVAMIDERNEIVYASKTLSELGNVKKPELAQGRPLIDLFPGRSLKIFAGKLLREKDNYAEDWEFSLDGQKRYFKAVSHRLAGSAGTSSGSLISLYDMTHLAERDEIAAMKDSMKIGLFFMDRNYIIQDHYSRYLEELLMQENLFGQYFTDIIEDSITPSELEATKDYFNMVLEGTYDQEMLEDINPLSELHYINKNTGDKKVFQCEFNTVERGHGEMFILVTVYDITVRVELQQRLAEEEARRQEEMQSVFELIQVDPGVFNDFISDMEIEFDTIDKILKNEQMTAHEVLVKVYQSIHAIKSNAVILGLNVFGNKVHNLESKIKVLREIQGNIPFNEMLNLTMDIEKVSLERENFKNIIEKLHSYTGGAVTAASSGVNQNVKVLIDSLAKAASRAAEDLEKQIKFISSEVDPEAVSKAPRRIMKEILTQLVRNSAVHGIEAPDIRKAMGKNETGIIKLSIAMAPDKQNIHIKVMDDGRGLDYKKIAERAVKNRLIKPEMANNKDILIKAIFLPGFSTAETEGVHGGRGIGLNLVRDRLKEIGGSVKLKTEDNKGTIFFLSLPIQPQ